MTNAFLQHPGLSLIGAILVGMMIEWVLEMFFFRGRLIQAEEASRKGLRDLEQSKFQIGRLTEDLRSKSDVLEASQRAKQAAETLSQNQKSRVTEVESNLSRIDQELSQARSQAAEFQAELRIKDHTLETVTRQLADGQSLCHSHVPGRGLGAGAEFSNQLNRRTHAPVLDAMARAAGQRRRTAGKSAH